VAELIGVTASHLSRVERGEVGLSVEMLEAYLATVGYRLAIQAGSTATTGELLDRLDPDRRRLALQLVDLLADVSEVEVGALRVLMQHWRAVYQGQVVG